MERIGCGTIALLGFSLASVSLADWTDARCDIYPAGSDHVDQMIGCTFSQRQGHITIMRRDDVTHDLTPVGDEPGSYHDQHGYAVIRGEQLAKERKYHLVS